MKKGTFLLGMAMGAAAGAGLEMVVHARKRQVKSAVGRTMETVSGAMDSAADTLDHLASSVKR